MTERTNIIKAIQLLGDGISNPGGDFAKPAATLLSENYTDEQLDMVETELATFTTEEDLDEAMDDGGGLSDLAMEVVWEGFELIEEAFDRGLIEGAGPF